MGYVTDYGPAEVRVSTEDAVKRRVVVDSLTSCWFTYLPTLSVRTELRYLVVSNMSLELSCTLEKRSEKKM